MKPFIIEFFPTIFNAMIKFFFFPSKLLYQLPICKVLFKIGKKDN